MAGYRVRGGGGGAPSGPAGFSDDFSIAIKADDTNAGQTDADTYAIAYEESDTVAGQSETVELKFPTGVWDDDNNAPTDGQAFTVRVWLSGTADLDGAPANASNADSEPDSTYCTLQTNVAGSNEESVTTDLGAVVPAGLSVTAVEYLAWFDSDNTLVTSKGEIWAKSDTAAFSDILIYRNQGLNTTESYLSTPLPAFDLYAAGVDTSGKLSSLQIEHYVNDAVAGVTPHVMRVDAGAIDIIGAF